MEFYDSRDMEYWRKQAAAGAAVIIEIPPEVLLDLDLSAIEEHRDKLLNVKELQEWLQENQEEMAKLARSGAEKKAIIKKLERKLYDKQDEDLPAQGSDMDSIEEQPGSSQMSGAGAAAKVPGSRIVGNDFAGSEEKARDQVTRIMAQAPFDEAQLAVVMEGMLEDLPPKYLLTFMKPEYDPDTMRRLLECCRKMYGEERR